MNSSQVTRHSSLSLLSVIIPARDEEGCIASTVEHLHLELDLRGVPHEIIVVDDGSTDRTWQILQEEANRLNASASVTQVCHGLSLSAGRTPAQVSPLALKFQTQLSALIFRLRPPLPPHLPPSHLLTFPLSHRPPRRTPLKLQTEASAVPLSSLQFQV